MTDQTDNLPSFSDKRWELIGKLPAGGTIIDIAGGRHDQLYVLSSAGIFHKAEGEWQPIFHGVPIETANCLSSNNNMLLVGGIPPNIFRSIDGGKSWTKSISPQLSRPLLCFAAHPDEKFGTLLAGTHGNGIFRSVDSGRSWNLANFGLHHFVVYCITFAPEQPDREVCFAGTDKGIFQSPNGGRGWRSVRQTDTPVLGLAVHPSFSQTGIVYAGTEAGELLFSNDGGRHWVEKNPGWGAINRLAFDPHQRLAALTSEAGLMVASRDLANWVRVELTAGELFALYPAQNNLYIGSHLDGLWRGTQDFTGWTLESLSARKFNWIGRLNSTKLLIAGVTDGVWMLELGHIADAKQVLAGPDIYDFSAKSGQIYLASTDGVFKYSAEYGVFKIVLANIQDLLCVDADGSAVVAGDTYGRIWFSMDSGENWRETGAPESGQPVIDIQLLANENELPECFAITSDIAMHELNVWRIDLGQGIWERSLSTPGQPGSLKFAGSGAMRLAMGGNGLFYKYKSGQWTSSRYASQDVPANTVSWDPVMDIALVMMGDKIMIKTANEGWQRSLQGLLPSNITSLDLNDDAGDLRVAYALASDGKVYRQHFHAIG